MKYIFTLLLISTIQIAAAQTDTLTEYDFAQGKELFRQAKYYDAYLRFRRMYYSAAAEYKPAMQPIANAYMDSAAIYLQRQTAITDSALAKARKITDAFYFFDGKLALAYKEVTNVFGFKEKKYGFINKKGDVVIYYKYDKAEPFDKKTGYAKVEISDKKYWIDTKGKEYDWVEDVTQIPDYKPYINSKKLDSLQEEQLQTNNLEKYRIAGELQSQIWLNDGIDLFNKRQFFDAYLRFNAAEKMAVKVLDSKPEIEHLAFNLKDTALNAVNQLFIDADNALLTAKKLIDAFYFYNDNLALAYKNGKNGFIDKEGNVLIPYYYTEISYTFNYKLLAKVKKEDNKLYFLDAKGKEYQLAEKNEDLTPEITALDLSKDYVSKDNLKKIPSQVFENKQLKILLLANNRIEKIPSKIKYLTNLTFLDLSANYSLTTLPTEIGTLTNLNSLDLSWNSLTTLPAEIGNLTNLTSLSLYANQLTTLPAEIGNLINLTSLDLSDNQLTSLPSEIGNLKNLKTIFLVSNRYESISYYSQKKWNSSQLLVCGCNLTARRVEGTLRGSPIYLEFNSNTLLSNKFSNDEDKRIKKLLPKYCEIIYW